MSEDSQPIDSNIVLVMSNLSRLHRTGNMLATEIPHCTYEPCLLTCYLHIALMLQHLSLNNEDQNDGKGVKGWRRVVVIKYDCISSRGGTTF